MEPTTIWRFVLVATLLHFTRVTRAADNSDIGAINGHLPDRPDDGAGGCCSSCGASQQDVEAALSAALGPMRRMLQAVDDNVQRMDGVLNRTAAGSDTNTIIDVIQRIPNSVNDLKNVSEQIKTSATETNRELNALRRATEAKTCNDNQKIDEMLSGNTLLLERVSSILNKLTDQDYGERTILKSIENIVNNRFTAMKDELENSIVQKLEASENNRIGQTIQSVENNILQKVTEITQLINNNTNAAAKDKEIMEAIDKISKRLDELQSNLSSVQPTATTSTTPANSGGSGSGSGGSGSGSGGSGSGSGGSGSGSGGSGSGSGGSGSGSGGSGSGSAGSGSGSGGSGSGSGGSGSGSAGSGSGSGGSGSGSGSSGSGSAGSGSGSGGSGSGSGGSGSGSGDSGIDSNDILCNANLQRAAATRGDVWVDRAVPVRDALDELMIQRTSCRVSRLSDNSYTALPVGTRFDGSFEWRGGVRAREAAYLGVWWPGHGYGFNIGENSNTKTVMYNFNPWYVLQQKDTPGILSQNLYIPFFIKIQGGTLTFGKGCGAGEVIFTRSITIENGQFVRMSLWPKAASGAKYLHKCMPSGGWTRRYHRFSRK